MNTPALTTNADESNRYVLPFLLLTPVVLLMLVTIFGYLFFTQQQISASLLDEEHHHIATMAQIIDERLSLSQSDIVALVRDLASAEFSQGETLDSVNNFNPLNALDTAKVAARFDQLFSRNTSYAMATVFDASGAEILRIESVDGATNRVAEDRLVVENDMPIAKAIRILDSQPLISIFHLLVNEEGYVRPHTPVLSTLMRQSSGGLLATSMRVESLLEDLNNATPQSNAEYWLLNPLGDWVARGSRTADFSFQLDGSVQGTVQAVYPEVWNAIRQSSSGSAVVASGQVAYQQICGRLNCDDAVAAPAAVLSGWKLVSYMPAAQLSPWNLLAMAPDRWIPMLSLLLVVLVICATGAWFMGYMIVMQRRNESRLQQATLLQHSFFEKNPEIMFVKNLDGTYYLANEMCRRLAGQPDADFSGRSNIELFPDEASSAMSQQDRQIIENEEAMEFHSHWYRDGAVAYFKTLRFPIYDQNQNLIAVGGIANDVTEQIHSRHALMENEKLLRTFIESAPDAVLISDVEGRVSLVNRQAELIFSSSREEMLSSYLFELVKGLTPERIVEAQQAENESSADRFREVVQSIGYGRDQRSFPVEFSLAAVNTDGGSLIICLLRDTSEKTFMETQLRQSQKMEAVGKLTGGMAHDFNNLLGIIIGNVTLALKQLPEGDERLEKRLSTVMKAADRGAELTKRMLAIARRQPLQPKAVVINEVVQELSLMLPQTLGSDIEMELHLTPDLPSILVDESGFEAMLLNLAINSRDAMPEGGTFAIQTGVVNSNAVAKELPGTRVQAGEYIHIVVSDTGEGMSEEALNKAFEPFFTTKEKDKGTGLGLAMIYGFVKQSRGFIVLDSEKGVGTSVNIYLPAMDESVDNGSDGKPSAEIVGLAGAGRVVLLVDDEVELLGIAEAYLRDLGFIVHSATSGKDALNKMVQLDRIDLLLTDVVMPGGMNGVALAREVTERDASVKVLYASGFPSGVIEENSRVVLDAPLLHKPYSLNALSNAIRDVLEQDARTK